MIGKTLAHYEITSQLGRGGMGEVYQAKDRKLSRDVAIKVLPEEFAKYADRVARFQRDLFPACENGHIDPNRPWRTAWRGLTREAGLKGLRFHDLRHHAVTELAEMGLSDQTIMSIAGHVSCEMLDHYSHIRLAAKRRVLEALETPIPEEQPIHEPLQTAVN